MARRTTPPSAVSVVERAVGVRTGEVGDEDGDAERNLLRRDRRAAWRNSASGACPSMPRWHSPKRKAWSELPMKMMLPYW